MIPKLVIFDCDGVLVDSEPLSNQVIADSLSRHGLPMTRDEAMDHFVGGTMAGVMAKAIKMGASLPGDWLEQVGGEIYAALKADVTAIPGVVDVLNRLDTEGVPYCVASNGEGAKMDVTLGATGMATRMVGRRFSAITLGVHKPEPDLFLFAADKMGVAPFHAVVIEDSGSGALAAKRAGMKCFGYAPGGGDELADHGAHVFRNMAELAKMLGLPE